MPGRPANRLFDKTMRLHHKLVDVAYMARDFTSVVRGTGYFHQPDLLGRFFIDGKSYYIDFRGKTNWTGEFQESVPVLFVPLLGRHVFFPGMILQYGLGCVDRYFETDDPFWTDGIKAVVEWLFTHCSSDGSFDNLSRELNSGQTTRYHSNNSAMTQGLAISFLARVLRHDLVRKADLEAMIRLLHKNMMLPMEQGGAALYQGSDLFLCEYCRTDNQVVLNGWIFATFGLFDFASVCPDVEVQEQLSTTLGTLSRCIDQFIMPKDNWSRYDNLGRISSPIYQTTHINQTDALYRLTGDRRFQVACSRLIRGNSYPNFAKYTFKKVVDKVRDSHRYSTVR